jgi:hypothetical protein
VPLPIEPLRTISLFDRVATVRDDRQSPFVLDLLTRCLTVVGLVGGHDERRSRRIQDLFDDLAVVDLTTSDAEVQWNSCRRWLVSATVHRPTFRIASLSGPKHHNSNL